MDFVLDGIGWVAGLVGLAYAVKAYDRRSREPARRKGAPPSGDAVIACAMLTVVQLSALAQDLVAGDHSWRVALHAATGVVLLIPLMSRFAPRPRAPLA